MGSPSDAESVPVSGVVTWVSAGDERGYFLQDLGEAATGPRGLWIFDEAGASAGERLWLRGAVTTRGARPALRVAERHSCGQSGLPPPRGLRLPHGGAAELEASDATLVRLEATAVLGAFVEGADGSSWVRLSDQRWFAGSPAARDARRWLDLGWPSLASAGGEGWPRSGDELVPVVGVLDGSGERPLLRPLGTVAWIARNPRPSAPPRASPASWRMAAMNLGNCFTTLRSRGAETALERHYQREKLLAALVALDADVLALLEVENDGGVTESELLAALNARSASPYEAAPPPESPGSDAIHTVLFHRPSRVTLIPGSARDDVRAVHRRPVRAQSFLVGERVVSVLAVHAKSRSCAGAGVADADTGEGCFQTERIDQSLALADFAAEQAERVGSAHLLLLGDFNAYPGERSLTLLADAGYLDRLASVPQAYSFVFDGLAGLLDHAFSSPSLAPAIQAAGIWHINADEPLWLDYRHASTPGFGTDAFRSSDHDPVWLDLAN
ncbi:MAG TPA: endonuclease/exonuclease/phosphatase family protein [Polyangiaceae bacterium]|nr:endonuclease/exonuclease/phosphatase family protein [Polyangiaceae bacterium]